MDQTLSTSTATVDARFMRNVDLINQEHLDAVTIIGAGGIGSALVTNAAIMGFKYMDIWDFDILEEHNLSSTTYPVKHLNHSKAHAAEVQAKEYGAPLARGYNEPWTSEQPLRNKVFLGPDNMEVRREVYAKWLDNPEREFLIDMRMGALSMEIITVTKTNDYFLEDWLPSNAIEDEPCTAKHTIFTASVSSGLGLTQAFKVLSGRPYYAYIWMSLSPISLRRKHLINHN